MARAVVKPDGVPRKRARGQGSIGWHNGAWRIRFRPLSGAGQVLMRRPGKTLAQVESELDKMVADRDAGKLVLPSPRPPELTVQALWEDHYKPYLQAEVNAGSLGQGRLDDLSSMMDCHILPALGLDRASSIDSITLLDYIAGKQADGPLDADGQRDGVPPVKDSAQRFLAPRTIRHHITAIGQMFRWAMKPERQLVRYDPTAGLRLPDLDEEETEPYEPEHVCAIIRLLEAGTVRRIGLTTFALGTRIAETLGAQETSWDDGKAQLRIRHTLRREGGATRLVERGKTKSAKRKLKTSDPMAEVVREQLAENAALPETARSKSGHLFRSPAGTPWNASNYRNRHWYPAVYAGYAKVMEDDERGRWLAAVPADMRPAAQLLCIEDISVRAVLDACWGDLDSGWLSYHDADGEPRSVELPRELADVLEARRERAYAQPRGRGARLPHERTRIFPGRRGQPIALPSFLNVMFRDPFERIGMEFDRRIHRARHTYVSLVAADPKVSRRELQRRAGHADASTTGRYTHAFRADEDQVADVLEQLTVPTTAEADRVERAAAILQLPPQVLRAVLDEAS